MLILSATVAAADRQIKDDIEFVIKHQTIILRDSKSADFISEATSQLRVQGVGNISEVGLLANGLINLYRALISSQDISACNFSPSCSHFASEAVVRGGFLRGTLLAADRLMRCHHFSSPQSSCTYCNRYKTQSSKIYDPVKYYINIK